MSLGPEKSFPMFVPLLLQFMHKGTVHFTGEETTVPCVMQGDVIIDETYIYDPTTYDLAAFLEAFNITSNRAAANASFPFLRNAAVYR